MMILNLNVFRPESNLLVLSSEDGASVVLTQNTRAFDMIGCTFMQEHRHKLDFLSTHQKSYIFHLGTR